MGAEDSARRLLLWIQAVARDGSSQTGYPDAEDVLAVVADRARMIDDRNDAAQDKFSAVAAPDPADTALDHATAQWHTTNAAIGEASGHGHPDDPYRLAALFEARAGWWGQLGRLLDDRGRNPGTVRNIYAIACSYAAELDRTDAAATRFRYRIPTLHPGADAARLSLDGPLAHICPDCHRPWQADRDGACPTCPDLIHGITPHNRTELATYPPGQPWTPKPHEDAAGDD